MIPYAAQLKEHFPERGVQLLGYCGAEFKETPPLDTPMAIDSRHNIEKIDFYECRGKPANCYQLLLYLKISLGNTL